MVKIPLKYLDPDCDPDLNQNQNVFLLVRHPNPAKNHNNSLTTFGASKILTIMPLSCNGKIPFRNFYFWIRVLIRIITMVCS